MPKYKLCNTLGLRPDFGSQVDGIGKGHLEKGLVQEALTKLAKRCKMLNEEALTLLTSLDG